jgi:hypothetical protein
MNGGAGLGRFLTLVRIAKLATLITAAWTVSCAVLLFVWQVKTWPAEGSWPPVRLSAVMQKLGTSRGAIYLPASASDPERTYATGLLSAVSDVPAIFPLLVALALLIAFYLWLERVERQRAKDP